MRMYHLRRPHFDTVDDEHSDDCVEPYLSSSHRMPRLLRHHGCRTNQDLHLHLLYLLRMMDVYWDEQDADAEVNEPGTRTVTEAEIHQASGEELAR